MRINTLHTNIIGAIILSFSVGGDAAESNFAVRSNRAIYDSTPLTTRSRGRGHSYAAVASGAAGVLENPASLGAMTTREVLFELGLTGLDENSLEATRMDIHVGGAVNINTCAPEYWPRETVGNHTVGLFLSGSGLEFSNSDDRESDLTGFTLGYGRSFRGGRHFGGASLYYGKGGLEDDNLTVNEEITRWEMTLGGITLPSERLALGLMFRYGRGDVRDESPMDQNGEVRHWEFRVGSALQLTEEMLITADISRANLDIDYADDTIYHEHKIWKFGAGVERVMIPDCLTLRGGIYYTYDSYSSQGLGTASDIDDYFGVTGGFSYFTDGFELAYTLDLMTDGDIANAFTVGFEW